MAVLEATINEKKRQVEKLVADMKEANLQSLAISPPEELKMILDGEFGSRVPRHSSSRTSFLFIFLFLF